jgi:hypothetical protein
VRLLGLGNEDHEDPQSKSLLNRMLSTSSRRGEQQPSHPLSEIQEPRQSTARFFVRRLWKESNQKFSSTDSQNFLGIIEGEIQRARPLGQPWVRRQGEMSQTNLTDLLGDIFRGKHSQQDCWVLAEHQLNSVVMWRSDPSRFFGLRDGAMRM